MMVIAEQQREEGLGVAGSNVKGHEKGVQYGKVHAWRRYYCRCRHIQPRRRCRRCCRCRRRECRSISYA